MTPLLRSAALLAAAAVIASPAAVEHRKEVNGFVINIGVVPAARLLSVDAYERSVHRDPGGTTHHVVVGVAEAKTGAPVADAQVTLELVDPHGGVQRKALERGAPGGMPDYSGLFRFGWSGDYRMKVDVSRAGASPVAAVFRWRQDSY